MITAVESNPGRATVPGGGRSQVTRQDSVEETWRIMMPLVEHPPAVHPYAQGTWGRKEADHLLAGAGPWHDPWVAS
jgi:glucose-6-phosphate 1-dehydrogenase